MSSKKQKNTIKFNFDISAYRLLGRELITDRITALFEIVKNSYDANSDRVTVQFIATKPKTKASKIIIRDDGIGMELSDLKYRWMVIGTSSKRRNRTSPAPYYRKVVGKKGIGRFAVDLLGSKLTLKTKKKGANKWLVLETDWSSYLELETKQLKLPFDEEKEYFTDFENKYWFEDSINKNEQGTILEIEKINNEWTEYDVSRLSKELTKLVSPNANLTEHPFQIKIDSQFENFKNKSVTPLSIVSYATKSIDLGFNKENDTQEIVVHEEGNLNNIFVPKRDFGLVKFQFHFFDQAAKLKFKKDFNIDIDGIKIYRDGIITTPFAEHEANHNKQKDILGIDKRRYSGFFDKVSSRDLMGFVEITDQENTKIVETTNRQDFIENNAYRELKLFIIEQIEQFEKLLSYERENVRKATKSDLGRANTDLKVIKQNLSEIKKSASPEVKNQIKSVEADLGKLQGTVNKSIKDYAKLEEENKQKENLFFSLVSLQTYASMFSHMTKHTIGHVIRDAEYFKDYFPNEDLNERFKTISSRIFDEFLTLRQGVDFMLKYAQSDSEFEYINLYNLLHNLFSNIYADIFRKKDIKVSLELAENLELFYNKKVIEDIFNNLISNSLKALKNIEQVKKIKCSGIVSDDKLTLFFSDNGEGILDEDKYRIFDVFFTRTAEDGGAGIGLYMVKTRIEAMNGSIEVVDNEFEPTGATFKILLPFKK